MSNAEELVSEFIEIRRARETLKAEYESEDNVMKEAMEQIKASLLAICTETNTNGLKTSSGTVTRQVKERFFCTDWDAFKNFVETEGSIDLLERRISQKNFKEFMDGREGLPVGINAMREYDIVVRKASVSSTLV